MSKTRAIAAICFILATVICIVGIVALAERDETKLKYTLGGVVVFGALGAALGARK